MPHKVSVTCTNTARLPGRSFPVYAYPRTHISNTVHNPATGLSSFTLPLEDFLKHALNLQKLGHLPNSGWYVSKVEVEDTASEREQELVDALEREQARSAALAVELQQSLSAPFKEETGPPPPPPDPEQLTREETEQVVSPHPDIEKMPFRALRALAIERKIPGYSNITKVEEMRDLVRAHVPADVQGNP